MCGISGIIANTAERYLSIQNDMVECMRHRGPDGNGIYSFSNCLLGHNRLSIIDLVSGDQPMLNERGDIGIAFNGEIYGFHAIRQRLEYNFKTTSDTEVIIALYERYGPELIKHLPGMFAFGLWDDKKQLFFAARDRFGEKPFYYTVTADHELIFASELKALVGNKLVKPQIDPTSVARYLSRGYVGPVNTIYKNIYSLPPAHYLTFQNGELNINRYWTFPSTTQENLSLSDAADKFEGLFTEAVKKQMVADVEVCAFLSGGLDSTSVVKAASAVNPALKTIAFGYKGELNELPFARIAAEAYRTDHHEILEEGVNIEDLLLELPHIYDEPFSDSSAIPTYLICKAAKKFGKVVLTGDGGDELLGGYTWWYQPLLQDIAERNSGNMRAAFVIAMATAEKAKEKLSGRNSGRLWRDKFQGVKSAKQYATVIEAAESRFAQDNMFKTLGLPGVPAFKSFWKEDGTINDAMKFDIADYMPGNILVKTDRAAMANSVELRSPFLDVELAEFCISMPGNFKTDGKVDKILLRESMGKYWPKEIQNRGKQGFGIKRGHWKDSPRLQKMYQDYLYDKSSPLYNILPYTESMELIKQNEAIAFNMLILSVWVSQKYS